MRREVVKDRSTRRVERLIAADGSDLHVKRTLLRGHPWRRIAALFGRNQAAREARNLRALAALGVRAAEVVSVGKQRSFGVPVELVLTTRTLEGFAPIREGAEADPVIAAALGNYVRCLHDHGVLHEDLHRGNLLYDGSREFALIDADRVRIRRSVTVAARRRGVLKAVLAFRAVRREPAWGAFLSGYGEELPPAIMDGLLPAADVQLIEHLRKRSRRALRDNPDFGPGVAGGLGWQVRRGFDPPGDPEAVLRDPAAIVKGGRSSTVAWLGEAVVLKVFHPWRVRSRCGAFLRGSRARRAFRNGHLLELLGIPTARVLGFAVASPGPVRPRAYLVTERVAEATHATSFLARVEDPRRRRAFLTAAGDLVGRLHRSGFAHRDLKGRNLLRTSADGCVLVDLDGLEDRGVVPDAIRLRDLRRSFRSGREVDSMGVREALWYLRGYQKALGFGSAAPLLRLLLGS